MRSSRRAGHAGVGEVGGDAGAHGSGSEDGYTSNGSHGCSDGNGSRVARDLTKVIDQHNVAALLVELRPQEPALIGRHGKAETWTLVERALTVRPFPLRSGSSGWIAQFRSKSGDEIDTSRTYREIIVIYRFINNEFLSWGPLGRLLTPFGSYVVLTEARPDLVAEIGWTGGEAITDCRMFLHYFRTTEDGRVLMGSGSGPIGFGGRIDDRFTSDRGTGARAEAGLRTLLPGLAGAHVEHAWGGPIDVSADHLPVFGTLPGTRIHYGAGYTGNGVGPSWLGGQILASLVLGQDDDWTRLPLVGRQIRRLPPEPINYLGGSLVRKAMLSVEDAETSGRRASAPARFVASLPSRLGLRVGTR